jgi:hypothetical protein
MRQLGSCSRAIVVGGPLWLVDERKYNSTALLLLL